MPSNYPGALHALPAPGPTTYRDDPGYELDVQVGNLGDILEAVQTKIGIGASTPSAGRVLVGSGTGVSTWAQVPLGAIGPDAVVAANIADGTVGTAELAAHAATQSGSVIVGSGATVAFGGALADIPGAFVDLAGVLAGSDLLAIAVAAVSNSTVGAFGYLALTYDSVPAGLEVPTYFPSAGNQLVISSVMRLTGLPAGTRRIKAQWRSSLSGTMSLFTLGMWAVELRR